jgi:hypothetical protein
MVSWRTRPLRTGSPAALATATTRAAHTTVGPATDTAGGVAAFAGTARPAFGAGATVTAAGGRSVTATSPGSRRRSGGNRAALATAAHDRQRGAAISTCPGVHLISTGAAGCRSSRPAGATVRAGGSVATLAARPAGTAVPAIRRSTTRVTTGSTATAATAGIGQRRPDREKNGAERQHD